jgi:SAM-dependent methyltransferase
VLESETIGRLPLEAAAFDLVINRHAVFTAAELHRILKPGGLFITQQVGGHNEQQLNQLLHADLNPQIAGWNLAAAVQQLETAGFEIVEQHETYPETVFYDIGAVVYYLKAVPWQIPGFSVDTYYDHLLALHHTIQASGGITVTGHRFFIEARRAD